MNVTPLVDKIFTLAIKSDVVGMSGMIGLAYQFESELYDIIGDMNVEESQMYHKLCQAYIESGLVKSDLTVSEIKETIINKVSNA